MYQQRVPTEPSAPKPASTQARTTIGMYGAPTPRVYGPQLPARTGPRGTTIQDVAQVASGQKPVRPATQWPAEPPAPAPIDVQSVYDSLIGAPLATAGEKYGGFPTAAQAEAFVRGQTYNAFLARQMAAEEAARLAKPLQEDYLFNLDPLRGGVAGQKYQENRAILHAGTPTVIPLSDAAIKRIEDRYDNEDQRRRAVDAAKIAASQRRVTVGSLETLARQMAGGKEPTQQDYYAANMARMNAARGASGEGGFANAVAMVTPDLQAALQRELDASGASRQQEIADAIGAIAPSDLMQRIAVEQLGYDPALAAGLFPASENLAYQQMLIGERNAQLMAQGIDPTANEAELVLAQYGQEGLDQYQRQQAEYAMYGTPSQQLAAQKNEQDAINAQADADIIDQYGFDPNNVSNVEADQVRQLMTDPQFTSYLEDGREQIVGEGKDALEVAQDIAEKYREATNQTLGAEALRQILASFDLAAFG
jgi:hypothetical protein